MAVEIEKPGSRVAIVLESTWKPLVFSESGKIKYRHSVQV